MKAKFHVFPIAAAPGLWSVLLEDADGRWHTWEEQIGGEFWSSIHRTRSDAIRSARESADQWGGAVFENGKEI